MLLRLAIAGAGFGLALCASLSASAVTPEAILAETPPKLLSEFGFFANPAQQVPADGVIPYDLATPLFSDHAVKYRFIHVPVGQKASYDPNEAFEFPVGSALVKTFAFPADLSKPGENVRLVETRVLMRQEQGWQAAAYVWNAEQTDATLKIAGAKVAIDTVLDGEKLSFTYSVPNKNQCKGCHAFDGAVVPLGPKARNLNKNHDYPGGPENQLAHWASAGILAGLPDLASVARAPEFLDASAPVDARARAWLDVNCAHCHRREGPASNSGLFLTFGEASPVALGMAKRPVAAGKGSGGRHFDIAPGDPDDSILLHRVESIEPGVMMPELGRTQADPKAVALLRQWIAEMR